MDEVILQVGVKAILQNDDGKWLLLKRCPIKYPEVDRHWDIVGGRIEKGVELYENLKREIMEETGLGLTEDPKLILAQDILRVPGKHVVRLTYVGKVNGDPTLSDEHVDYGWFSVDELHNFKKEGTLDIYFSEVLDNGLIS